MGGYFFTYYPLDIRFDLFNRGPNRLQGEISIISFEVITGAVYLVAVEISAFYEQVGAGPVADAQVVVDRWDVQGLFSRGVSLGGVFQYSMHYDHTLLGYNYPQADQAVTLFENNVLFPRPGGDVHVQNGDGRSVIGPGGLVRVYLKYDLNASFQSASKTQHFWGAIHGVWLLWGPNSNGIIQPAPGGRCEGNNCPTPTPTPAGTPTATPFLTPAPTPTPWGCIEIPPWVPPAVNIEPSGSCVVLVPPTNIQGVQVPEVKICSRRVSVQFGTGQVLGYDLGDLMMISFMLLLAITLWRVLIRR